MIALRECRNVLSGAPQRRTADLHVSQKREGKRKGLKGFFFREVKVSKVGWGKSRSGPTTR